MWREKENIFCQKVDVVKNKNLEDVTAEQLQAEARCIVQHPALEETGGGWLRLHFLGTKNHYTALPWFSFSSFYILLFSSLKSALPDRRTSPALPAGRSHPSGRSRPSGRLHRRPGKKWLICWGKQWNLDRISMVYGDLMGLHGILICSMVVYGDLMELHGISTWLSEIWWHLNVVQLRLVVKKGDQP